MKSLLLAPLIFAACTLHATAAPLKVLIVDGQNNHQWALTTPVLKEIFEENGFAKVDVATSPAKGQDMSGFEPNFAAYQAVVSNYNGAPWPDKTRSEFEKYVSNGGGFVSVHAADNSFPEWEAYNVMIGVGGWGGRSEKSGPWLRLREGKWVGDTVAGGAGHHGQQHEFLMVTRAPEHPIAAGLPAKWMHTKGRVHDRLRGLAQGVTVLASAFSDPASGGSGARMNRC